MANTDISTLCFDQGVRSAVVLSHASIVICVSLLRLNQSRCAAILSPPPRLCSGGTSVQNKIYIRSQRGVGSPDRLLSLLRRGVKVHTPAVIQTMEGEKGEICPTSNALMEGGGEAE